MKRQSTIVRKFFLMMIMMRKKEQILYLESKFDLHSEDTMWQTETEFLSESQMNL